MPKPCAQWWLQLAVPGQAGSPAGRSVNGDSCLAVILLSDLWGTVPCAVVRACRSRAVSHAEPARPVLCALVVVGCRRVPPDAAFAAQNG